MEEAPPTRYMGLDIGDKWIGVALSDPSGVLASPFTVIKRESESIDLEAIASIVSQQGVRQVIAGLPRCMNGTLGRQAEKVTDFVRKLSGYIQVPVEFCDERLTTISAKRFIREIGTRKSKRARRDDSIAAAIILQGYIDEGLCK